MNPTLENAIVRRTTYDLQGLTVQEIDALCNRLYPVHCEIFAGVSQWEFRYHVLEPRAERTILRIFFNAQNEIVGYCSVHRFRRVIDSRSMIVVRAEAGLKADYRRGGITNLFVTWRFIKFRLAYPFANIHYLGTLVHPSGYHKLCTFFPLVFPTRDNAHDPRLGSLAAKLANSFSDPPVYNCDPLIRKVGWVTIERGRAVKGAARVSPHTQFYSERNPGYRHGEGLVVVVPLSFVNLGRAVVSVLLHQIRRSLHRLL